MRGQVSPHSHTWLPYITPNGVRLAHEILTNSYSYNQTQGFIGDTNFPMTNKKLHFSSSFSRLALTFTLCKLGCTSAMQRKKILIFLCIAFGLH